MNQFKNVQEELFRDLSPLIQTCQATHSSRAVLMTTRDRDFALSVLRNAVADSRKLEGLSDLQMYHFTVASRRRMNFEKHGEWETIGHDQSDACGLLQQALEMKKGGLVVLEECLAFLADKGGDVRMRMALAQAISKETRRSGLILLFLESSGAEVNLPSILAEQFLRLEIPFPRKQELEKIAKWEISAIWSITGKLLKEGNIQNQIQQKAEELAPEVVGMTRSAARDAIQDALMGEANQQVPPRKFLHERKTNHLSRELAMNVLPEAKEDEFPVGLDYLLEFIEISRAKMMKTGSGRAKGILLIGPPGTGKTMLAKAIGQKVHLPVVEFRISSLMNSFLGETERRFSQAFATLEAMSPNVVFIDEIEKAFGDSSERDGGTMMRVTGSLLSWLSDNLNSNFIVATSNNLRRMGEIELPWGEGSL